MKIIFLADLRSPSASGHQRLWAMQQCGVKVTIIDKQKYTPKLGPWAGYIGKLFRSPRMLCDTAKLKQELIYISEQIKPDIIWFEWAKEFQSPLLKQLKQIKPKPFLVSFQDDNPWGDRLGDKWQWRDYFNIVPDFDLHLVKRTSDIENLKSLGAKSCRLWRHGLYSPLFYPHQTGLDKQYPVSFVGTCMDRRVELIRHLLTQKIPVHVFGNKWKKRSDLPWRYPANFHSEVEGEDYADVIRKSQVCLGLVSHSNRDEWTMRTYEVPACAGLLLAERTSMHEELFAEGREAEFFSTPQECVSKLQDLLPDPERCMEMGEAAYNKFYNNNWSLEASMQDLLNDLNDLVSR